MNPNKIYLNGFEYTFTDDREWIYKAVPLAPGKVKSVEKPSHKVIEEIEQAYEDVFEKMLVGIVKNTTKVLLK